MSATSPGLWAISEIDVIETFRSRSGWRARVPSAVSCAGTQKCVRTHHTYYVDRTHDLEDIARVLTMHCSAPACARIKASKTRSERPTCACGRDRCGRCQCGAHHSENPVQPGLGAMRQVIHRSSVHCLAGRAGMHCILCVCMYFV